jgi:hypothetical protein
MRLLAGVCVSLAVIVAFVGVIGGDLAFAQACDPYAVRSIDATGDSITKAYNGQGAFPCPFGDQPAYNWATGMTSPRSNLCGDIGSVFSLTERLECLQGRTMGYIANPNAAVSGADMRADFVNQANLAKSRLQGAPAPRLVTVLMGHNDICSGKVWKYLTSCAAGADQDRNNYCRTTPAAYEREYRKGLNTLIQVPDLTVAAASMVRVSQLCNHGAKWSCSWFAPCQWGWSAVAYAGWIFGRDNGICGSLTADCSDQRIADAYEMSKKYRDIIMRVTAEYASIPVGAASPWVYVGGQWVGGAVKAPGVKLVYSDATWRYQFESSELNCCDCFHPSPSGQNAGARVTFNGLNCSASDQCCLDAWWDPVGSGRCQYISTGGRSFPGFFQQ